MSFVNEKTKNTEDMTDDNTEDLTQQVKPEVDDKNESKSISVKCDADDRRDGLLKVDDKDEPGGPDGDDKEEEEEGHPSSEEEPKKKKIRRGQVEEKVSKGGRTRRSTAGRTKGVDYSSSEEEEEYVKPKTTRREKNKNVSDGGSYNKPYVGSHSEAVSGGRDSEEDVTPLTSDEDIDIYKISQYYMTKVTKQSVKFPLKRGSNNIGTEDWSDVQSTSKFNHQYVVIVGSDEVKLITSRSLYVNNQRFEHGVKPLGIGDVIGISCDTTAERNESDKYDDLMLCSDPSILNGDEIKNTEIGKWIASVDGTTQPENDNQAFIENKCFPATVTEFYPLTGKYKTKFYDPFWYYEFSGNNNHITYIAIGTLKFILSKKNQKVRNVFVDLTEKNIEHHQEMLRDSLKACGIKFELIYETTGVDIPVCDWSTLLLISRLEVSFDVIVSGGGTGTFDSHEMPRTSMFRKQSTSKQPTSKQLRTSCDLTEKKRTISVGVIDTGSLPPSRLFDSRVYIHPFIFNTNYRSPKYTEYSDNLNTHGTAVVEILQTSLLPGSKIYVARVSRDREKRINATKIVAAMNEFQRLNVDVINCSFSGTWNSPLLSDTLKAIQSSGIIIIASAGNGGPIDCISSDLDNGKSIMVGSYNMGNFISSFSSCKVDICGFGQDVVFNSVTPNVRSGTSYAVPRVTAAVANFMSFSSRNDYESIKKRLVDTADDVHCSCTLHDGKRLKLKMSVLRLSKINFDVNEPASKRRKTESEDIATIS